MPSLPALLSFAEAKNKGSKVPLGVELASLTVRYGLAMVLLLIPLNLFQALFESVTLGVVVSLLEIAKLDPVVGLYSVRNAISILGGKYSLLIVKYCVTASAYYLWALLVLVVKQVSLVKRLLLFLVGTFLIFLMNLTRILILVRTLIATNVEFFDALHTAFWLGLSTVYVLLLWVVLSRALGITKVPVVDDFRFLWGEAWK